MELEVETSTAPPKLSLHMDTANDDDTTMISPSAAASHSASSSSSGFGGSSNPHENALRLSEIESAHLCPSARMKMEELFKQWLNVDGTKDMIHAIVADIRSGKDMDAIVALYASNTNPFTAQGPHSGNNNSGPLSGSGVDLHSPSRSPKRPPNYHHFGTSATNSPNSNNSRKKLNHVVSLFGDELHGEALEKRENGDVVMKANNNVEEASAVEGGDQGMTDGDNNNATNDNNSIAAGDADHASLGQLRKQIPKLYTPGEGRCGRLRGLSTDSIARKTNDIETRFADFADGMKVEDFVAITKDLCGFPSFFNAPFFRRILASVHNSDANKLPKVTTDDDAPRITKDVFQAYWTKELAPYDSVERFFRVVKQPQNDYIERDDFAPFLHELLKYHPGLEFLGNTPEFQEKYDRDSSGKITLRKLRRSNLIDAFNCVDEEEDINKVNSYFSYEHFYVLYCKFWELDTDHDFLLSQDDLVRYGGHALTRVIVDRIFEHGRRPFARVQSLSFEEKKKMSYEDFIYFMLSEEDKSNPVSIRYWFELIDTNEDGVIRSDEMRTFYRHQIHRMECLGHEVVPFEDVLCQMSDLLHPAVEGEFYHKDFIREDKIRVSGVFFNVLFNLSKFIEFEQRDPFLLRQQLAEPELTDWDRYARAEYARLAMEEECRDDDTAMDIDTMDGWYVSDEQDDDIEIMGSGNNASTGGASRTVEAPF
uniref:EF-hand domain-containing protein n=1 Tax=Globisporangium ultimum (strain ATCC 200006 / CBS 805.95 / DAOM BR144) TaxID=431595 RepID=K3X4R6_GLOUD